MEHGHRARGWAAVAAVSLLLCMGDPRPGDAGSLGGGDLVVDSGGGKSVRLSLKISGVKKKKHQVSFYKSVARQAKTRRPSGDRSPSSER
ncbi:MAG: hypothetical protein ACXWWT_12825 [Candidatus Deferrimicrobiaceae bacterium]